MPPKLFQFLEQLEASWVEVGLLFNGCYVTFDYWRSAFGVFNGFMLVGEEEEKAKKSLCNVGRG